MKRRCFVFLMAFLFISALIVEAEKSGAELENVICGSENILEEIEGTSCSGEEAASSPADAGQSEAALIEPSDDRLGVEESSQHVALSESGESIDSAAVSLPQEMDEDTQDISLSEEIPVDLTNTSQGASGESAVAGLDTQEETDDDALLSELGSSDQVSTQEDPVLIDEIFAGIAGSDTSDQPETCQSELQYPSDALSVADLKISSSLDPIRLIRLPDGCRVEGEIHFTVVIQNMSSQNLRVRAMPVFSEKAQALYMELGISLDQDAVELMVESYGVQSLIWRFTAIAGKTAGFDPSLINAQDLVFQLRVAVEAVMP